MSYIIYRIIYHIISLPTVSRNNMAAIRKVIGNLWSRTAH